MTIKKTTIILVLLAFFACKNEKVDEESFEQISLVKKGEFVIDIKLDDLNQVQRDSLFSFSESGKIDTFILGKNQNNSFIRIASFYTAFEAGKKGFFLFEQLGIDEYEIMGPEGKVTDSFREIPLIGSYLGRPALYHFDLLTKKTTLIWGRWGKKVLSSAFDRERNYAFFLTALLYGQEGEFPYITNARLYHYTKTEEKIESLEVFDKGNQLYLYKKNHDEIGVVFTHIDSNSTRTFSKEEHYYKFNGEWLNNDEKIYELLVDGFPAINNPPLNYFSPTKQKRIYLQNIDDIYLISILDKAVKKESFLFSVPGIPDKIEWNSEEDFAFISSINAEGTTSIYIINVNKGEVVNVLETDGPVELVPYGDLLIFDKGFNENSRIIFYNFRIGKIFYELNMDGGCGINFIRDLNR